MNKKQKRKIKTYIMLFMIWTFLVSAFSTQQFAKEVGYNPVLGTPIFAQKKIYLPWKWLFWTQKYKTRLPDLAKKTKKQFVLGTALYFLMILIFEKKKKETFQGSAEWATKSDINDMDLYSPTGLVLGKDKNGKTLRISEKTAMHVLMSAPTRMGKGINTVIPTAYDWKGSIVFNDIKGELWGLTSGYRKNVLHQTVLMFNPLDLTGASCCYNPLDYINVGTTKEMQDVEVVSRTIIDLGGGGGNDEHWVSSAINLVNGVIMHLIYSKENPTLVDVIDFLSTGNLMNKIADIMGFPRPDAEADEDGNVTIHTPFNHLKKFNDPELFKKLYNKKLYTDLTAEEREDLDIDRSCVHPLVEQEFTSIFNTPDKERGSIESFAKKRFKIFKDPLIMKHMAKSDFKVEDLMKHKTSLYLVTPPESLERVKPILRLIICQAVYRMTKPMQFDNKRYDLKKEIIKKIKFIPKKIYDYIYPPPKKEEKNYLLFLLDEFRSLGKMDIVSQAMTYIAGYGVRFLIILQSLKQLEALYGKANDIQDNCSCQLYLTPNDLTSAETISKLLGNKTTMYSTKSQKSMGGGGGTKSTQYTSEPLMRADEVRKLPYEKIIIFMATQNPILGKKIFYFNMPEYKKKLYQTCEKSDSFSNGKPIASNEKIPQQIKNPEQVYESIKNRENPQYHGAIHNGIEINLNEEIFNDDISDDESESTDEIDDTGSLPIV